MNFKKTLQKLFSKDENGQMKVGFNGSIEVMMSPQLKISGAVGHMYPKQSKSPYISEIGIGISGTNNWALGCIDEYANYTFFFEVVNPHEVIIPEGQFGVIQFRTNYYNALGQNILRVTTVARSWVPPSSHPQTFLPGFDIEAAASIISKLVTYKAESDDSNSLKWIDKHLIQFMHRYSTFTPKSTTGYVMPEEISLYPQFMFHLRRGPLVSNFGNSPDYTTFIRHYLLRENVSNTGIMIQPSLESYGFDEEDPVPLLLSLSSAENIEDKLLLFDSYFVVVISYGKKVASWKKLGYQDKEEYANFKELLEAPFEDASVIINNRFPTPLLIDCDQGSSQFRYLLAFLDPENNLQSRTLTGNTILSEDISLDQFLIHLINRTVNYEK